MSQALDPDDGFIAARIAIVGLGLMGGSLALALRGKCAELLGVDKDPDVIQAAQQARVVDVASAHPETLLPRANVIVLAAPVRAILELLEQLPNLHPGPAVILDLGSTKETVLEAMDRLPPRFDPIGGHPMCGRERSSLANADAALYHGAAFALLPLERTTLRARRLAESLARAAGATPVWLDPKTHDRLAAATSHAPYLLANSLAAVTPPEAALLIGPGFRSSARLAGTPPGVMLDILATNRQNILEQLQRCRQRLEEIEACLSSGDETGLAQMLGEGRARYLDLMSEAESRGGH